MSYLDSIRNKTGFSLEECVKLFQEKRLAENRLELAEAAAERAQSLLQAASTEALELKTNLALGSASSADRIRAG